MSSFCPHLQFTLDRCGRLWAHNHTWLGFIDVDECAPRTQTYPAPPPATHTTTLPTQPPTPHTKTPPPPPQSPQVHSHGEPQRLHPVRSADRAGGAGRPRAVGARGRLSPLAGLRQQRPLAAAQGGRPEELQDVCARDFPRPHLPHAAPRTRPNAPLCLIYYPTHLLLDVRPPYPVPLSADCSTAGAPCSATRTTRSLSSSSTSATRWRTTSGHGTPTTSGALRFVQATLEGYFSAAARPHGGARRRARRECAAGGGVSSIGGYLARQHVLLSRAY